MCHVAGHLHSARLSATKVVCSWLTQRHQRHRSALTLLLKKWWQSREMYSTPRTSLISAQVLRRIAARKSSFGLLENHLVQPMHHDTASSRCNRTAANLLRLPRNARNAPSNLEREQIEAPLQLNQHQTQALATPRPEAENTHLGSWKSSSVFMLRQSASRRADISYYVLLPCLFPHSAREQAYPSWLDVEQIRQRVHGTACEGFQAGAEPSASFHSGSHGCRQQTHQEMQIS